MRFGLTIKIEDEGDNQFKQFSLLKDTDVRYTNPSEVNLNSKGDV